MKMRMFRKTVIWLMVFLLAALPIANVAAATVSSFQKQEWNEALLQFLIDEFGAEHALELYQWLQDVRLIDENGQMVRHPIVLDGQAYTLEAFKDLLASGELDLAKTAYVDGRPIPVEALKTIMELEDRLAMLAENERLQASKLTPEHLDSLISILQQAATVGLSVYGEEPETGFRASAVETDYGDEAIVALVGYEIVNAATSKYFMDPDTYPPYVELTFELNKPQDRVVSFEYEIVNGAMRSGEGCRGTVVFPVGQTAVTVWSCQEKCSLKTPSY